MSSANESSFVRHSFVGKKTDAKPSLKVLETKTEKEASGVTFKLLKGSLTANNKFYWAFGGKPPFSFFKCFPVNESASRLEGSNNKDESSEPSVGDYANPVIWGIVEVIASHIEDVTVGTRYLGMVPIGDQIHFAKVSVNPEDGNLSVHRPGTLPFYNLFQKIASGSALASPEYRDLALPCFPGITTGFGLYHNMLANDIYGADAIVVTSASSKVALALALNLKEDKEVKTKVIGYTSASNKGFCEKVGLYDKVLTYDELLSSKDASKYVMVDISGRGDTYTMNVKNEEISIVKFLGIGNASNTEDEKSSFATFSTLATVKLIGTMMGLPSWLTSWMKPTQELYLIIDELESLKGRWGQEKLDASLDESGVVFCKAAVEWMNVRQCNDEESIKKAFTDIMEGVVPPSETIVLDAVRALAPRYN